jgi:putative transposase
VCDHVHVAVCIAPSVSPSEWVRQVKGLSAYAVNAAFPELESSFRWQEGYGLLTFGEKALPLVKDYIDRQQEKHAQGKLFPGMEQTDDLPVE